MPAASARLDGDDGLPCNPTGTAALLGWGCIVIPPAIAFKGVRFTYPDGTRALNGLTLTVKSRDRIAVLGPNGAGKSTLLHAVLGFIATAEGAVEVDGLQVVPANLTEIRQRVGIVFQDPDDQLFCPTLLDDVRFGPRNQGLSGTELYERVHHAVEAVGLWDRRDRHPHRLSVGEKKRGALATVLSMRPDILLLDEPSAHLDGPSRRSLRDILSVYEGTLLLVSQDLPFAAALCTRAVVLESGRVTLDIPMDEMLNDPVRVEQLGIPAMELCALCAEHGWRTPHAP
ncbi:ABC transporter ATP-binding protein [Candidatus Fermentibacteria bacterium]|nr:ABC transporter ATP-binding protein [Candidatus Fermentibacteria bacterium]